MQDLTVVIASKNQGHWFKDTIESLKKQSYQNFKVIVIDAYSSDDTESIINSYNKIQLIKSDTKAEPAMFHGLNLVDTKYVTIMCTSDFYYEKKWFEIAISELEKDNKVSCVWSNAVNINENGNFTGVWKPEYFLQSPPEGKNYLPFWFINFYLPELNMIVKTDVLKKCIDLSNYNHINSNYLYQFYFNFTQKGYLQKYINCFGHAGRSHSNSLTELDINFEKKNRSWIRKKQFYFFLKLIFGIEDLKFKDSDGNIIEKYTTLDRLKLILKIFLLLKRNFFKFRSMF